MTVVSIVMVLIGLTGVAGTTLFFALWLRAERKLKIIGKSNMYDKKQLTS